MRLIAFRPASAAALLIENGEDKILLDCVPSMASLLLARGHDPLAVDFIMLTYGNDANTDEAMSFLRDLDRMAKDRGLERPPNVRAIIAPPRAAVRIRHETPPAWHTGNGQVWFKLVPVESNSTSFPAGKTENSLHVMCFRVSLGSCVHCSAPDDFLYAYKFKPKHGRGMIYAGAKWPRKEQGGIFSKEAVTLFREFGKTAPCLICDGIQRSTKNVLALMSEALDAELVLLPRINAQYSRQRLSKRFAEVSRGRVILAQHGVPFEI